MALSQNHLKEYEGPQATARKKADNTLNVLIVGGVLLGGVPGILALLFQDPLTEGLIKFYEKRENKARQALRN